MHPGDLRVQVLLAAAHGDEVVVEGLGAVLDAGGLLDVVARAADGAARGVGGAAHAVVLLEHQDVRAQLARAHTGDKARHARADDDDIRLDGDGELARLSLALAGERRRDGLLDGAGGDGRARHAVHLGGLRLDDGRRELFKRGVADARGLLVAEHLYGGELAALDGDAHFKRAAHAVGGAGVDAVCGQRSLRRRRGREHHGHQRERDDQARELGEDGFFHGFFLLFPGEAGQSAGFPFP